MQRSPMRKARHARADVPIESYPRLTVEQVRERLDDLSPAQIRRVREYERRHKGRKTLLDLMRRRLEAK